ncbi:Na+/H+ antiporter subunit D, partial [Desulfobacteraceae bacterium SEEP-SAG9]
MLHDHLTVLPVLIPLIGAMISLMLRQTRRLQAAFALGSILMSLVASAWLTVAVWQGAEPIVFHSGGWSPPFGITLVADLLSAVFVLMSQL